MMRDTFILPGYCLNCRAKQLYLVVFVLLMLVWCIISMPVYGVLFASVWSIHVCMHVPVCQL